MICFAETRPECCLEQNVLRTESQSKSNNHSTRLYVIAITFKAIFDNVYLKFNCGTIIFFVNRGPLGTSLFCDVYRIVSWLQRQLF